MQKFRETALTIRNGQVRALPGATVSVYLADTNTLAELYANRAGTIDLRNPFEATDTGLVEFHAADGLYDLVIQKSGFDTIRLPGVSLLEGVLSAGELTAARFGNEAAVPYAAGLMIERETQTVEYLGVIYQPKPEELDFVTSGTFEVAKFQQVRGVTSAGLKLSTAAAGLGLDGGSDALLDLLQDFINGFLGGAIPFKWFGAACNGVTDDSNARDTAFDFCITNRRALILTGTSRVTRGYTNDTAGGDLVILGYNPAFSSVDRLPRGSCFLLDNDSAANDPNNFFYSQETQSQLRASNVRFACKQTVVDRKFFRTSAPLAKQSFENAVFNYVEKPFAFEPGTYMQGSSYKDIHFFYSGSFHSEGVGNEGDLVATGTVFENIFVEGTMPANTDKVICNLDGFRHSSGKIFVIEPAVQSTGWTALKLHAATADTGWVNRPTFDCDTFWVEVTGYALTYTIDQAGGRVALKNSLMTSFSGGIYKLDDGARVEIDGSPFVRSSSDILDELFDFGDEQCHVTLRNVNSSNLGAAITHPQITLEHVTFSPNGDSAADALNATSFSNTGRLTLWKFDGSLPDSGQVLANFYASSVVTPSAHPTYGRCLIVTPGYNVRVGALLRGPSSAALQWGTALKVRLPTWGNGDPANDGVLGFYAAVDDAALENGTTKVYTSASSGQVIDYVMPATTGKSNATSVGFLIVGSQSGGSLTNITIPMEICYAEIWTGRSAPSVLTPSYPAAITMQGSTSAPVRGVVNLNDRFARNPQRAGQPKGWVCAQDSGGSGGPGGLYSTTRANTTPYAQGVWALWTTGTTVWECVGTGTSAGSAPSISGKVVGDTVVDGTVTWLMRSLTAGSVTSEGNL